MPIPDRTSDQSGQAGRTPGFTHEIVPVDQSPPEGCVLARKRGIVAPMAAYGFNAFRPTQLMISEL
jgi:hypothetical protein